MQLAGGTLPPSQPAAAKELLRCCCCCCIHTYLATAQQTETTRAQKQEKPASVFRAYPPTHALTHARTHTRTKRRSCSTINLTPTNKQINPIVVIRSKVQTTHTHTHTHTHTYIKKKTRHDVTTSLGIQIWIRICVCVLLRSVQFSSVQFSSVHKSTYVLRTTYYILQSRVGQGRVE